MPQKAVFETTIDQTWATGSNAGQADQVGDKPGDIRWQNGKCYKCVIFDNGGDSIAAVIGKAAYYINSTGYPAHTVTMDFSSADAVELAAGIFQSIPADTNRCWLQIKGPATLVSGALNSNANDGLPLTGANAAADGELNDAAAITEPICGAVIVESTFLIMCDFPF